MPARRCSICSINYPTNVMVCPECQGGTWHSNTDTPGEPKAVATEELPAVEPHSASPAYAHRVERYTSLGFSEADCHVLASATEAETDSNGKTWTRPLNWLRVAAAINSGCTHAQALVIFS